MLSPQCDKRTGAVPPGLVMMALGSFRFGMTNGAYQQFSRSAGYRWNKLDRIGREPALQYLGPDTLTISARAADMTGSIRARKTRTWTDVTIADIVAKIAAEEGLEAQVSDSLKARFYPWLAQTSESDLNFLTRLARDLDAIARPAGGALLFLERGAARTAQGAALPVFDIHRTRMKGGFWTLTGRGRYGRVTDSLDAERSNEQDT